MDEDRAKEMKVKTTTGALVTDVSEESPAEKGGIKEDDIIVEFNGTTIDDAQDLMNAVRKTKPKENASVVVMRNDQKKKIDVTLGKSPVDRLASAFSFVPPHIRVPPNIHIFRGDADGAYGLDLLDLNPQLGEYFGTPDKKGVLVERVEEESAAEKAGFKAGDVIVKIGPDRIEDTRDVWDAVEDYKKGEKMSVEILRKGSRMTLTLDAKELTRRREMKWRMRAEPFHIEEDDVLFQGDGFREGMNEMRLELRDMSKKLRDEMKDLQLKIRKEVKSALNI
jgi:serine protease Do